MRSKAMRRRIIARVIVGLIALLLIIMIAWMVVAGPGTVLRVVRYGDTNIDDFSHYPGRELEPSGAPNSFPPAAQEMTPPQDALAAIGSGYDFEVFLEETDTIAFLVIQNNTIIFERYYQGHSSSSLSQIFSVTKSFTSALIGLAIEDGLIEGVDQHVIDFIPELGDQGFDIVTIHHLLTMMSGSNYQENDNPFGEHVILNFTPELEAEILRFEMETDPGAVWRYKSGDNALLGLVLARALAPETITQYAQRKLWSPLGMEDGGVWTIDHQETGLEKTWCCLATSARDLAKFGVLYLNSGVWGSEQIISDRWIAESTQRLHVPEAAWPSDYQSVGWRNYGYQWWLAEVGRDDFFGLGKDGQFLYVNPQTDTVIVRLGWSAGDLRSSQWVSLFQGIAWNTGE